MWATKDCPYKHEPHEALKCISIIETMQKLTSIKPWTTPGSNIRPNNRLAFLKKKLDSYRSTRGLQADKGATSIIIIKVETILILINYTS